MKYKLQTDNSTNPDYNNYTRNRQVFVNFNDNLTEFIPDMTEDYYVDVTYDWYKPELQID